MPEPRCLLVTFPESYDILEGWFLRIRIPKEVAQLDIKGYCVLIVKAIIQEIVTTSVPSAVVWESA